MLAFIAAMTLALSANAGPRRSFTAEPGIVLNALIEEKAEAIGAIYLAATRRRIHVTSGVRPPLRQARAMYQKLRAGGSLGVYKRQDLVRPVREAYLDGRRKRLGKERTIAAMAEVLERQVADGQLLSSHLSGRAFDVRSSGLTRRQKAAFREAVRRVGGVRVIEERRPPHFHLEIERGD